LYEPDWMIDTAAIKALAPALGKRGFLNLSGLPM
jgi:hypothetical protein